MWDQISHIGPDSFGTLKTEGTDPQAVNNLPAYNSYIEKAGHIISNDVTRRAQLCDVSYQNPRPEYFKEMQPAQNGNQDVAYKLAYETVDMCVYTPVVVQNNPLLPIYVVFRGTSSMYDVIKDITLGLNWAGSTIFEPFRTDLLSNIEALKTVLESTTNNVEFIGHSLGGLQAMCCFHLLMKENYETQRLNRVTVYNPACVPIQWYQEIHDICSNSNHDHYNEYRSAIFMHIVHMDIVSHLAEVGGAFGNVTVYPSVSDSIIEDLTGIPYLQYLDAYPNHVLSNFIGAGAVTELKEPVSIELNTKVNIKSLRTGKLSMHGVDIEQPVFLYGTDGSQLNHLEVSHPEVNSQYYERFSWNYQGNLENSVLVMSETIIFTKIFHNGNTNLYLEVGTELQTDNNVSPIGSCSLRQRLPDGSYQYIGLPSVAFSNMHLPLIVSRTIDIPSTSVGRQRHTWVIDSTLYSHAGHRRDLSNSIGILGAEATTVNVTIKDDEGAFIHSYATHQWGTYVNNNFDNGSNTLIAIKNTYPRSSAGYNSDSPYPATSGADESIWTLTREDNVYTLHNTETNDQYTCMLEVDESAHQHQIGEAHVKIYSLDINGVKQYWTVTYDPTHPDYPHFGIPSKETVTDATNAMTWIIATVS